jgi:RecA/RadA recombinase
MSALDPVARELWRAEMVKEYGDEFVHTPDPTNARLMFRSPMLTWATGGGVKIGHFGRWYGPEGSGKSLTNLGLIWSVQNFAEVTTEWYELRIRNAELRRQKIEAARLSHQMDQLVKRFPDGMDTMLYDTEQRFEASFAQQLGIDMSRVEISNNNTIEEILDSAKKAFSWAGLVIIDSATNAESIEAANTDIGGYTVGSDARAWKGIRNMQKSFNRNYNTFIFVDQMRANIPQGLNSRFLGPPAAPPNVRILRHRSSLALAFDRGKWLYLDKNMMLTDDEKKASNDFRALGRDGKEVAGIEMRCKVDKNSTGKPFRNARLRFRFPVAERRTGELVQRAGWDNSFELLEMALHFEIIEVSGSRYYMLDHDFERTGDSWHGEAKARQAIEQDQELHDRILARVALDL